MNDSACGIREHSDDLGCSEVCRLPLRKACVLSKKNRSRRFAQANCQAVYLGNVAFSEIDLGQFAAGCVR